MKITAKELVEKHESTLKSFTTLRELYNFAKENGFGNSAQAFSTYKKALLDIGIDYDTIKRERQEAYAKSLNEKAEVTLVLYSDANCKNNRFAVCNGNKQPVYFGNFFNGTANQAMAELEAAKKALWVAVKVKEHYELEAMKLVLYVDAEWLTYQDNKKQKGFILTEFANKNNIVLEVVHISGKDNPADKYTQEPKKYNIDIFKKLDVGSDFDGLV